jgi:hypothetical protein
MTGPYVVTIAHDRRAYWTTKVLDLHSRAVMVPALLDDDLVARRVSVLARDVVFVRGLFEASEGLGALFAESGGELILACPRSRVAELDELLADLVTELSAVIDPTFVQQPGCAD